MPDTRAASILPLLPHAEDVEQAAVDPADLQPSVLALQAPIGLCDRRARQLGIGDAAAQCGPVRHHRLLRQLHAIDGEGTLQSLLEQA